MSWQDILKQSDEEKKLRLIQELREKKKNPNAEKELGITNFNTKENPAVISQLENAVQQARKETQKELSQQNKKIQMKTRAKNLKQGIKEGVPKAVAGAKTLAREAGGKIVEAGTRAGTAMTGLPRQNEIPRTVDSKKFKQMQQQAQQNYRQKQQGQEKTFQNLQQGKRNQKAQKPFNLNAMEQRQKPFNLDAMTEKQKQKNLQDQQNVNPDRRRSTVDAEGNPVSAGKTLITDPLRRGAEKLTQGGIKGIQGGIKGIKGAYKTGVNRLKDIDDFRRFGGKPTITDPKTGKTTISPTWKKTGKTDIKTQPANRGISKQVKDILRRED
jgi:hypothetical protein